MTEEHVNVGRRSSLGPLKVCSARTVGWKAERIDWKLGFQPSSFRHPFAGVPAASVKRGT